MLASGRILQLWEDMGEYFPKIAIYRPGRFVRDIPVTVEQVDHDPKVKMETLKSIDIKEKLN